VIFALAQHLGQAVEDRRDGGVRGVDHAQEAGHLGSTGTMAHRAG
jgi:hypothetical protein